MGAPDGIVGSDTRETISSGKQTAGELLSAAQHRLRRVFLTFVIGLILTIYAMRAFVWPILQSDLIPEIAGRDPETVAITPFDVILMQAKVGLVVGVVLAIPVFIYYARDPLKARGWYPEGGLATRRIGGIVALAMALFIGGIVYSYNIFFPVMFDFLAKNAASAGLSNTYSIVLWTEFILILGLSFGVAAQLPLFITALSYSGVVRYETFRDNWRYAVVGMFGFGALFSPPDPFTQAMWAGPLVILYAVSLYFARLAVAFKRGGSLRGMGADARSSLNRIAAVFVLASGLAWLFFENGVSAVNDSVLPSVPANFRPGPIDVSSLAPLAGDAGVVVLASSVGLVVAVMATLYYAWPSVNPDTGEYGDPTAIDLETLDATGVRVAPPEAFAELEEEDALAAANDAMDDDQPEKARAILDRFDEVETQSGDDSEGDSGNASDGGDESDAGPPPGRVERATATMFDSVTDDDTDPDDIGGYYHDIRFIAGSLRSKTFRIFAVFIAVMVGIFYFLYSGGIGQVRADFLGRLPDAVTGSPVINGTLTNGTLTKASIVDGTLATAGTINETVANATATNASLTNASLTSGTLTNGTVANTAVTNGTVTNASLTNASLTNVSLTNVGGVNGTLGNATVTNASLMNASITDTVLRNVSAVNGSIVGAGGDLASQVDIVVLHPVEALVFEVKISVLFGLLAAIPFILYYAWPALKKRGLASGNRNVFFGWAGAVVAGLFAGSAIGYLFVAPSVISYLVWDALQANLVIAYRVSNFFWLIFFTTVGIGLLADIPVTMFLFHRGGIVSYGTLRKRWRVVVLGTLVAAGLLTPGTVLSMILVTIPIMLAYAFGLGVLWLYTLRERRTRRVTPEAG
jgi:sec-independent protein translocase protein TatC